MDKFDVLIWASEKALSPAVASALRHFPFSFPGGPSARITTCLEPKRALPRTRDLCTCHTSHHSQAQPPSILTRLCFLSLVLTPSDTYHMFFNLFIFNWRIISFTILGWLLPCINMSQPQVCICPVPLEHPSHHPPRLTPLVCHRAPACGVRCMNDV